MSGLFIAKTALKVSLKPKEDDIGEVRLLVTILLF